MFNNDMEIYKKIGEVLYNNLPIKWTTAIIEIERSSATSSGFSIYYLNDNKRYSIYTNDMDDDILYSSIDDLYNLMTAKSDKHKWNKAKVTLTNEGDFNIKFDWDQEMYDEIERLNNEYDPRWDDTLTQEEKIEAYEKMKDTMY